MLDPVARGHVSLLEVESGGVQATAVLAEVERLRRLDPAPDWHDFAILSRTHDQLSAVRALLERKGVPIRRALQGGLPPLVRIREFNRLLTHLNENESSDISIPELRGRLADICSSRSYWTGMASRMLVDFEAEFGAEPCAVVDVAEALHRGLADHHHSHVVGDGVLEGTVHAAKGLEFAHVIVLGGGWKEPNAQLTEQRDRSEEERRLYYVAMTRARKTLTLIDQQDDPLPFARELELKSLRRRKVGVAEGQAGEFADVRYTVLGMRDLFIDFAGWKPEGHRAHGSLARMQAGDPVTLERDQAGQVVVLDRGGVQVGCLSKSAAEAWQSPDLQRVDEVRVLGMVSRGLEDCELEYRDLMVVPTWELPVLKVRYRRLPIQ